MMKQLLNEWRKYIIKEADAKFVDMSADYESKLKNDPAYKKFQEAPGQTITIPYSQTGTDNINFFNEDGTPRVKYRIPGTDNWLVKDPAGSAASVQKQPAKTTEPEDEIRPSSEIQGYERRGPIETLTKVYFYKISPLKDGILGCINYTFYDGKGWEYYEKHPDQKVDGDSNKCIKANFLFVTTKQYKNLPEVDLSTGEKIMDEFLKTPDSQKGYVQENNVIDCTDRPGQNRGKEIIKQGLGDNIFPDPRCGDKNLIQKWVKESNENKKFEEKRTGKKSRLTTIEDVKKILRCECNPIKGCSSCRGSKGLTFGIIKATNYSELKQKEGAFTAIFPKLVSISGFYGVIFDSLSEIKHNNISELLGYDPGEFETWGETLYNNGKKYDIEYSNIKNSVRNEYIQAQKKAYSKFKKIIGGSRVKPHMKSEDEMFGSGPEIIKVGPETKKVPVQTKPQVKK